METASEPSGNVLIAPNNALLNLANESWRFAKVFARAITKLDAGEQTRYVSQYRFYIKQLEDALDSEGFKLVNLEGHQFDPGTAATAVNLDEFKPTDILIVDQMLEPLIMNEKGIVKTATVILRKV